MIEVRQVFEMTDFPPEVRDEGAEKRVAAALPEEVARATARGAVRRLRQLRERALSARRA